MKRLISKALLLGALITALGGASQAQAHRYSSAVAAQKMESLYRSHCGNGVTWVCLTFPSSEYFTPVGAHSWQVELHWQELHVANSRYCAVIGRVEHDYVAEIIRSEWCWG